MRKSSTRTGPIASAAGLEVAAAAGLELAKKKKNKGIS